MAKPNLKVAVGRGAWHHEFAAVLDARIRADSGIEYDIVDIDAHDWQARIAPYDLVIWRGRFMGPNLAAHYKEKIYFMEQILGKVVMPGYASVWHFESKVAQSYLFEAAEVLTPRTVATVDYDDGRRCLARATLPIVAKQSHGASSANVKLLASSKVARHWLDSVFFTQAWQTHAAAHRSRLAQAATALPHGWFWRKVRQKLVHGEPHRVAYWQEFVADNAADLRITVVGDSHAIAFWRHNRPGDFRASGSGLLDYETAVPEDAVEYCIGLNRRLGFDSMAYDLLFHGDKFVVIEISYGYLDKAVFNAAGHYVLGDDGSLRFEAGHVMPQELWVDWALRKAARRCDSYSDDATSDTPSESGHSCEASPASAANDAATNDSLKLS
jgi:glutathione synthase/RimK-type ligase-like ATP-grasp enzyme